MISPPFFVPKGKAVKIPSDLLGLTNIYFDPAPTDPAAAIRDATAELAAIIERAGPK
jgi:predicted nucleotide-binding protein